jgi:hypothetical protein
MGDIGRVRQTYEVLSEREPSAVRDTVPEPNPNPDPMPDPGPAPSPEPVPQPPSAARS